MIELKGFSDYRLKIETWEIYSLKDGDLVPVKPCGDSRVKSWYLYTNGVRERRSMWALYLENQDAILSYCRNKIGIQISS